MTLAEHMEDGLGPAEADVRQEGFRIDGPKTAEWALLKLRRARARQAENTALADAERERINEWEATENAKLDHDADFFTMLLLDWHHRVLAEDPGRKTIALPAGKLVARKQPDRWRFTDSDFIAWAMRAGRDELIRQPPPEVNRAEAKKALEAFVNGGVVVDPNTGEKAEGVSVEPGDVKFTVEVTP